MASWGPSPAAEPSSHRSSCASGTASRSSPARQLVSDGRAGRVAVRPRAAVNQMQGAPSHRGGLVFLVAVAAVDVELVLEAAVPAVERSGQGGAFHLNIHPVSAEEWKKNLS